MVDPGEQNRRRSFATLRILRVRIGRRLPEAGREMGRFNFSESGIAVFLTATTNGVVRCVLAVAGNIVEQDERRLRGGRLIGPIERLIIFGLAIAGEPTAAALVVSAKSILRFPELTRTPAKGGGATERIDSVTEYFLLGSLTSWFMALAPALLVAE